MYYFLLMSTFIVKWLANRVLKDNQFNKFGVEDPYYEYIAINPESSNPKFKKVARRIPEGLSQNDLSILLSVKKQAYRYDMWFNIFGVKVGWSNLVGLVPILGGIISTFWSLRLYWHARSLDDGLPLDIQLIFLFNVLVDFLLGLIPFVGDLIEIGYKANLRNFLLLEKHLIRVGEKNLGHITKEEVRPGFINDKIQPFVEENIVPQAIKAGDSIKLLVNRKLHAGATSPPGPTAQPTIQKTEATATATLDTSDTASIHSLAGHHRRALYDEL